MAEERAGWCTAVLVVVGVCAMGRMAWGQCTKVGPCKCQTPNGFVDLTPLASSTGTPKYKDKPDNQGSNFLYSWNPCTAFDELTDCKQVSGCQVTNDFVLAITIGTQDSATFDNSTGTLQLRYSGTDKRSLVVDLICDPNIQDGNLEVDGETSYLIYTMRLTSAHCCIKTESSDKPRLSAGTIVLMLFVALLVVYLLAGVILQKAVRKATGREIIPNYSLWSSVPGLIMDGVRFTFSCGRASYEKL